MKKISLIAIVALLLASCSKVTLDNKYVEESAEKNLTALVKSKAITEEEKTMITNYISDQLIETEDEISYADILGRAKEEKARIERNADLQKELDEKLSVVFIKKYNKGRFIKFDAKVTNNTDTAINGYSFRVSIKDGAGNELLSCYWNDVSTVIKAKSSTKVINRFRTDIDGTDDNSLKLAAVNLDQLQIDYHIRSIIFDDGTSIALEE